MVDLAIKIAAFLAAILVLVTVHEFGHFWVARRLGVKVLRFSVGFGRPLLRWQRARDPTEYVIAAIPLGGYIKMLDEREEPVPATERHLAFNRQRLWKRSAIVAAGPVFNLLFAVLLYWGLLIAGESGLCPEVGTVAPQTPASAAGFRPGDEVLEAAGRETPTWSSVWFAILAGTLDGEDVIVRVRDADGEEHARVLDGSRLAEVDPGRGFLDAIGLARASPPIPPVIGEVVDGDPAAVAGIRTGDRVLAVDGEPIEDWQALTEMVQQRPGETVRFAVERDGRTLELTVQPRAVATDDGEIGRIGAGVQVDDALWAEHQVTVRYGPLEALSKASQRVFDVSVLTVRIIGRMLVGSASVENISSPIGIADTAGKTATYGADAFIQFLALLSVSLGLVNLLPIPILDGGHLLYFAIEGVTGRPLSEAAQQQGQRLGLVLLLSLMTLAFYVDIARLLGQSA
jgi:regulator of sigma E protease